MSAAAGQSVHHQRTGFAHIDSGASGKASSKASGKGRHASAPPLAPAYHARMPLRPMLALLPLAGVIGCDADNGAIMSAREFGDRSHPAERGRPDRALLEQCGAGALTTAGEQELRRLPYLQATSDHATHVLFTTAGDGPIQVDVETAAGVVVATVPAEIDVDAHPANARQRRAVVDGLAQRTVYCYRVRGPAGELVGRSGFRTAPSAGGCHPIRFVAFGDSGSGSTYQWALAAQLATVPFDLIVHTGDLAYGRGRRSEIEANFFAVYAGLLRHLPAFPVAGNHDYSTEDAAPFREVFDLPANERWYSFDWGDVHFVALDTERVDAAQAEWLDADLAANRRPWTIVYLHRPPFSSGTHGSHLGARETFAPIFERHHVALVLAGHDHDYERTKAVGGVHYVVTGGGGRGTRSVGTSSFTAFATEVIHFVYVTVDAQRLTLHAIDGTGGEFDSLVLAAPSGLARACPPSTTR